MVTPQVELIEQPWAADAACLGRGWDLHFAHPSDIARREAALALCQVCPVRIECLAHALEHDEAYGIWGGKTERQRRAIRHRARGNTHG